MPDPTPGDAPVRAGWKVRASVWLAIGLAAAGLGLGVMNTVGLAVGIFGRLRGFHASARLVPLDASATTDAPEDAPEEASAPEPVRSVAPPPQRVDASPLDAEHDAGHDATPAAAARPVDAGVDVVLDLTPRYARCDAGIARRVDAVYARSATFRSRFEQELSVRSLGSSTRSRGSLVVAKPGRMSWTYDDPEDSRIVSDGQTVSVYEAPTKRLFRVPEQSSPYPAAFAFLTGEAPLAGLFDFGWRLEGPDDSVCVLKGTPRAFTRAYQRVLFYIDRVTLDVRRVVIVDRAGDENRIDLVDASFDVPVADDAFAFTPPPGTIVVGR